MCVYIYIYRARTQSTHPITTLLRIQSFLSPVPNLASIPCCDIINFNWRNHRVFNSLVSIQKILPTKRFKGCFRLWDICIITLFSYLRLKRKNETIFPISLLMIISPEDAYKYKNDRKSLTPISIRIYFFIVHYRQHPFLKKIFVLLLSQLALLFLSYSIYPNSLSTSNNTLDRKVVSLT